jgi:uncharacterized protein YcfJ
MKVVMMMIAVFVISGCAQTTGYRPVIDVRSDPRAQYVGIDDQECQRLASDNAGAGKGALVDGGVGALAGGAIGAVAGAFAGNPAIGAAIGASAGGIGGVAKGAYQGDENYKRIYKNCMRGRGHTPLD